MLFQSLPIRIRFWLQQADRYLGGFRSGASQCLVSHRAEECHQSAAQCTAHGPSTTTQERPGKGSEPSKGKIVSSSNRLFGFTQDASQQSAQISQTTPPAEAPPSIEERLSSNPPLPLLPPPSEFLSRSLDEAVIPAWIMEPNISLKLMAFSHHIARDFSTSPGDDSLAGRDSNRDTLCAEVPGMEARITSWKS